MPATFNWFDITEDEQKPAKPNLNDWDLYAWAGGSQRLAKMRGLARQPMYVTPEYEQRVSSYTAPSESAVYGGETRRVGGEPDDTLTPGEKFAQGIGSVTSAMVDRPYGGVFSGLVRTGPEWLQDFTRAAVTGIPQTVADVGGSIADWVTGNTGKNQNYTVASNAPTQYKDYGGIAQTLGSFAPDIAMAVGTFGATAPAAAAASASKIPGLARLARLAIGAEEAAPTAIKFMGRAISPAATRLERVAATLAGAVPTAANVLPEVTAGRMSPVEGVLSTGMGALGGTLAAGQWGGSAIKNVLSDMAVNMATQAGSEAVTLLPGGAEFDAAQAWKNMLYGAGLGAAFGVMNAAPIRGAGERVTLGSRPAPEVPQPTPDAQTRFTGGVSSPVDIARNAERTLFGESSIPEAAQAQEVGAFMQQMRERPASEMVTLRPDETGAIKSVSDAYLTGRGQESFPNVPESSLAQAADVERKAYANSLAAEFAQTPEVLAKVLDLEVKPGEITPENAQQVLASKIENEWLVQAANGKGVAAVENILTQAGLRGAAQTPGPVVPGQAALPAAPVPARLGPAVAPELPAGARSMNITPENLPPVIAGELPAATTPEFPAGTRPMSVTPENMPPRIAGELTAGTPEAVAAKVEQQVEQLKIEFGPDVVDAANSARMVADLTDQPIESIVPPDSPVLQAAKSLENIENSAREELAQQAPAQEVIAGEPVAPEAPVREKRKRIVREIAKTAEELPMLESIAETMPDRTVVSETAVASVDPRDAAANRAGQKIAEWAETVRVNSGDELRGRRRTAQAGMNMVADMIKPEGSIIELHPTRVGGKVSAREEFLSTISGMTIPEFRAAVADGQTDFAGSALKIEPVGKNSYNVTFPEKNIVGVIWDSFNAARNVASPEVKEAVSIQRTEKSKADRIYGTSEDIRAVFEDATDIHSIYPELPDFAVLEPSAAIGRGAEEDALDVPMYVDESKSIGAQKDIFRAGFKNKMDRANKYFYDFLEKKGVVKELGIDRLDAKRVLMSKLLPSDFINLGKAYVERMPDESVALRLQDELSSLLQQDERAKATSKQGSRMTTPLDEMMNIGSKIPDSYFEKAYDRQVPEFIKAQEHAATIARKAGIADPIDVWRYFMWQQEGPRPKGRRKMQEEWGTDFDDAKATEIGQAIDKVVNTDADVFLGVDGMRTYLSGAKGADAFQGILDANLLGNPKNPMMGLRNLPLIRNSTIFPVLYALDQYVDKIEDDETFFGIPGKTAKAFLGDGETTSYAMAGMFGVAVKGTNKAGQRTGYRARMGDTMRRAVDANLRIMGDNRSFAGMTPEQKIVAADNFMAEFYPSIKPGTPEYDQIRAQKFRNESYAALAGRKISDVFNLIRQNSTKGTVGIVAQYFSDINNLGARSQFVKDYIVNPYSQLQSKTRQLMQSVEDPLNRILPQMVKRHGSDTDFWDAFWAMDYRMSDIDIAESGLTSDATRAAREEVTNQIKKEYFNDAASEADARRWDDFNQLQKSIDSLRREHFRALVAKSLGINSWNIETHYGELKIRKDSTAQMYGAATQAKATIDEQLKSYTEQYNSILKSQGKEAADQAMPGFKTQRSEMLRDLSNAKSNIRQMGAELDRIGKRMTKIEDIDALVQKSIENRYLFRTRDGKAPFVLRLAFDESTGLPSVRREYNSRAEAELGRAEYLREAVSKKISTIPGYLDHVEKRSALQSELETLTNSTEFSEANDARIQQVNEELDKLDGFKPLSQMTDAEVFRFAQTYDMVGPQKTVRDMRGRLAARKGSNTANLIIDQIMSSTGPVKGKILSGTIDPEAITPNYIKGKGNSALAEQANGEVMMFEGENAPTVGDIVDAIAKRVDEPVDRTQLENLIEQRYTYREPSTGANNSKIETIWIDMAALRQTVDAYLDPAVPNLSRRHNWVGYYDPDGKWDAKQKIAYTVESLETMTAQIKNYNQWTSLRNTVSDAMDWLNKWDINNGLREYVAGMTMYNEPAFNNEIIKTLAEYEGSFSRYVSMGTLFANVGSAIGNRLQGATMTFANGMQNAVTKYGVRKTNADGTESSIQWLPSEAAASAFVAKKQLEGEASWRTVEGMKWQGLANPKSYGYGVAAMVAPGLTLRTLARMDGYEKLPRSQQGYWALVYDSVRKANLTQGGVVGSYAIREGIQTGTMGQKLSESMGALTQFVETVNNYGSVLASAANAEGKFGLTATDWRTLNQGQRNSVIDDALFQHREAKAASVEARGLLESQIAKLREEMATQTGKQKDQTQRLIDQKLSRIEGMKDEGSMLADQLTNYLVYNRGYEQGNWDAISKAKFERMILSLPGGRLAMTMTAPILRSMNAWQGMWRRAGATEGGGTAKMGRAAAPFMGAAILTVLLGGAANTIAIPGGVFLADIGNIAEYLYYLINNEENEKLDKAAPRQMWEKLAADLGPKYGIPSKEASNFVRAAWSEGYIRMYSDVNINAGSGILDLTVGGTPAQTVVSYGKGVWNAASDIVKVMGGSGSVYDFMWNTTNAMPTSAKRLSQTALNVAPGGQGAVKLDRDGNPIIDPFTGKPQYLNGWDIAQQTFLGKPWSETRSILTAREGGTPLYTPADKVAWANHLTKQMPYVKFGNENVSAAIFEKDAEELQRAITLKTRTYKSAVEEGKNFINSMYNNNDSLKMPDGTTKTFREILSETAMAGIIPSTELKGKGAESVRNKLLQLADQWGRSRAAAEAVNEYYGGNIPVEITDKQLSQDAAYKFALKKLGQMYSQAWVQGRLRRRTRERLEP